MLERFVITEFFRKPDEDNGLVKTWYNRRTWKIKRQIVYYSDGIECLDLFYDEDGNPHRGGDQPAVIHKDYEKYYFHGNIHRGHYKPAVIHSDGRKEYWVHGEKRSETLSLKK